MPLLPVKNSHSQLMEDEHVRDIANQFCNMELPIHIETDGGPFDESFRETIQVMSPNKKWALFRGLRKDDKYWIVTYDSKLITPSY